MALNINTKAPPFTLPRKTAEGLEEVSLSSNFGKRKTVLLFFPLSFTSVCQDELSTVSSGVDDYRELNAAVWGISVDSPFSQEAFAEKAGIGIPLLSDFNKEVSAAYEVQFEELKGLRGVAKRSAFVIDEDGVIRYSWSSDNPRDLPPFDEIKQALAD